MQALKEISLLIVYLRANFYVGHCCDYFFPILATSARSKNLYIVVKNVEMQSRVKGDSSVKANFSRSRSWTYTLWLENTRR